VHYPYEDVGVFLTSADCKDQAGNIWFNTHASGVHRYDGTCFSKIYEKQGIGETRVLTIFEDTEGRMWFGGKGGLIRYDGKSFVNVINNGPWE